MRTLAITALTILTLLAPAIGTPEAWDHVQAIRSLLDNPAAYHARRIILQGKVHQIQVLVPKPTDPDGSLPSDFYEPWCRSHLPLLTFVLEDLTGHLRIGVSSQLPCGPQPPVYPPITELAGIADNEEVIVEVEVQVRWQAVGPWMAPSVTGRLASIRRAAE